MTRVAHCADIHVRNLHRHDEYKIVFEDFVRQCKEQSVEHIFVGGDVFHTKVAGMSPECIDFMCWMFEMMASVAEVHVMLGNHDGLLNNQSRQDAISPILSSIKNSKIKLYKKSGCYEFSPGFVWCVYSLFDEDAWKDVKPVPGKFNIACYHGPVLGAKTETDWLVEDGLTIEFFKEQGYDACMLGDIHKTQYLGYRDVELVIDECDLSKYPGADIIEESKND